MASVNAGYDAAHDVEASKEPHHTEDTNGNATRATEQRKRDLERDYRGTKRSAVCSAVVFSALLLILCIVFFALIFYADDRRNADDEPPDRELQTEIQGAFIVSATITIVNLDFTPSLSDAESRDFIDLENRVSSQIYTALSGTRLENKYKGIEIQDVRSGSVIVDLLILLCDPFMTADIAVKTMTDALAPPEDNAVITQDLVIQSSSVSVEAAPLNTTLHRHACEAAMPPTTHVVTPSSIPSTVASTRMVSSPETTREQSTLTVTASTATTYKPTTVVMSSHHTSPSRSTMTLSTSASLSSSTPPTPTTSSTLSTSSATSSRSSVMATPPLMTTPVISSTPIMVPASRGTVTSMPSSLSSMSSTTYASVLSPTLHVPSSPSLIPSQAPYYTHEMYPSQLVSLPSQSMHTYSTISSTKTAVVTLFNTIAITHATPIVSNSLDLISSPSKMASQSTIISLQSPVFAASTISRTGTPTPSESRTTTSSQNIEQQVDFIIVPETSLTEVFNVQTVVTPSPSGTLGSEVRYSSSKGTMLALTPTTTTTATIPVASASPTWATFTGRTEFHVMSSMPVTVTSITVSTLGANMLAPTRTSMQTVTSSVMATAATNDVYSHSEEFSIQPTSLPRRPSSTSVNTVHTPIVIEASVSGSGILTPASRTVTSFPPFRANGSLPPITSTPISYTVTQSASSEDVYVTTRVERHQSNTAPPSASRIGTTEQTVPSGPTRTTPYPPVSHYVTTSVSFPGRYDGIANSTEWYPPDAVSLSTSRIAIIDRTTVLPNPTRTNRPTATPGSRYITTPVPSESLNGFTTGAWRFSSFEQTAIHPTRTTQSTSTSVLYYVTPSVSPEGMSGIATATTKHTSDTTPRSISTISSISQTNVRPSPAWTTETSSTAVILSVLPSISQPPRQTHIRTSHTRIIEPTSTLALPSESLHVIPTSIGTNLLRTTPPSTSQFFSTKRDTLHPSPTRTFDSTSTPLLHSVTPSASSEGQERLGTSVEMYPSYHTPSLTSQFISEIQTTNQLISSRTARFTSESSPSLVVLPSSRPDVSSFLDVSSAGTMTLTSIIPGYEAPLSTQTAISGAPVTRSTSSMVPSNAFSGAPSSMPSQAIHSTQSIPPHGPVTMPGPQSPTASATVYMPFAASITTQALTHANFTTTQHRPTKISSTSEPVTSSRPLTPETSAVETMSITSEPPSSQDTDSIRLTTLYTTVSTSSELVLTSLESPTSMPGNASATSVTGTPPLSQPTTERVSSSPTPTTTPATTPRSSTYSTKSATLSSSITAASTESTTMRSCTSSVIMLTTSKHLDSSDAVSGQPLINFECSWEFIAVSGQQIRVEFLTFDLGDDTLELVLGTGRKVSFSGSTLPESQRTEGNTVIITLRTNSVENAIDFRLLLEVMSPGVTLTTASSLVTGTASTGTTPLPGCDTAGSQLLVLGMVKTLTSPGYPIGYLDNLECVWMFQAVTSVDVVIRMEFQDFNIGDDTLFVGTLGNGIDNFQLTGSTLPPPIVSSSNMLSVRFESNGAGSAVGFSATVQLVPTVGTTTIATSPESLACVPSHALLSTENKTVTSPGYPTGYSPNMDCEWTLQSTMSNSAIAMAFVTFDLGDDTLRIQFGETDLQYTGETLPPPIKTGTDMVLLRFTSNEVDNNPGFELVAWLYDAPVIGTIPTTKEITTITSTTPDLECVSSSALLVWGMAPKTVTSPGYPKYNYASNTRCSWDFVVTDSSKRIHLQFVSFNVGDDRIDVKYGPTQTVTFTGSELPRGITTLNDRLRITLITDSADNHQGFEVIVTVVDG